MEQSQSTGHERKGKHLRKDERVVMERMSRGGRPPRDIAEVLGRARRTIERELVRGRVEHRDSELRVKTVYNSDRGQDVHDLNATAKGPELKLGSNHNLAIYVDRKINSQSVKRALAEVIEERGSQPTREVIMALSSCQRT